ncbi:hypothetical protein [Metabacillus litoralis]|uniref:hypothetical protein n=1 Tax=Metabacillus litoralis TaxID=152268 RepID=UPI00204132C2|nr:hypothetical protein [Metabacillus litoralis]MCM3162708.1 hypothetical protein [Metabacillus litoralis]
MVSNSEISLFLRELDRLIFELKKCNDSQVLKNIYEDIQLLLNALAMTAID